MSSKALFFYCFLFHRGRANTFEYHVNLLLFIWHLYCFSSEIDKSISLLCSHWISNAAEAPTPYAHLTTDRTQNIRVCYVNTFLVELCAHRKVNLQVKLNWIELNISQKPFVSWQHVSSICLVEKWTLSESCMYLVCVVLQCINQCAPGLRTPLLK